MMKPFRPHLLPVLLLIIGITLAPALLDWLSIDLGSQSASLDAAGGISEDAQFYAMAGAIHHAFLDWGAVFIAAMGGIIALLHYQRMKEVSVAIVGIALICAGLLDAYHILASSRVISANAPNADFAPFTWAISRCFTAAILVAGITLNLWLYRKRHSERFQRRSLNFNRKLLWTTAAVFLAAVLLVIAITQQATSLPKTIYPHGFITRPFDALPLALFVLAGILALGWYRLFPSAISIGLLLSLIPQIGAQIYMSFGSTELFDHHFNAAHILKGASYFILAMGVLVDLIRVAEPRTSRDLNRLAKASLSETEGLLRVGHPQHAQTLVIPSVVFALAVSLTLIVGVSFYLESYSLLKRQEINNLKARVDSAESFFTNLYQQSAEEARFLSRTPPIQGIIRALENNNDVDRQLWRDRLEQIFSERINNKLEYFQIRYIGLADSGRELVNVVRRGNTIIRTQESLLQSKGSRDYVQQTVRRLPDQVYFSKIEYNRELGEIEVPYRPVLRVATPVFDDSTGSVFGVIVINIDLNPVFDRLDRQTSNDTNLYLANEEGDFIIHTDRNKTFGFELNRPYKLAEEFPYLINSLADGEPSFALESLQLQSEDQEIFSDSRVGFYHLIRLDQFGARRNLQLLLTIDDHSIVQTLAEYRNTSILLGLSLALGALALAILASRRLIAPLQQTIDALEDYEAGDENPNLPIHSKDEVGVFARRFHNLIVMKKAQDKAFDEQRYVLDQHAIVAITDIQGTIVHANRKFCNISGYSKEELLGRNHRLLNSGHHSKDFFRAMFLAITKGEAWQGDICNRAKNGSHYWVETTVAPFMDDKGKPRSYIAIRTDITKKKQIELELISAKVQAENAAAVKSEFLASMSHEIRTPMNGVLGMLNLLQKTDLDKEQNHRLHLAQSSAQSLLTLINDILDFSKVEAGKMDLEIIDFDIHKLIADFSESIAFKAHEKDLELIVDSTDVGVTHAKGDPGRIRQILTNLVSNAIKFTERGEIIIRSSLHESAGSELIFTCKISDTGIGIPAEKINTLFDTFTQVDASTTRKFGGTGLGLSIVKKLCELMEGSIAVTSKPEQGTCFEFCIVLHASAYSQQFTPPIDLTKAHFLVVDGNGTNRMVLSEQLENWGAKVDQAIDGPSTLELLEVRAKQGLELYDMAFLDMNLPSIDGAELGKWIKNDPRFKDMQLVIMAPSSENCDAEWLDSIGFSAYFTKPATPSDLFDATATVLSRRNGSRQDYPLVTRESLDKDELPSVSPIRQIRQTPNWPPSTRILLVEDNQINQEVAKGLLEDIGISPDIAADGREALAALKLAPADAPYTLVFMDCQMPIMDGFACTQSIRAGKAGQNNAEVPIIAMTANAMKGDKEQCIEAGMVDYISKPIDEPTLRSKLQKWLLGDEANGTSPIGPEARGELSNNTMEQDKMPEGNLTQNELKLETKPDTAVWDLDDALKRVGGKPNRLQRLINLYMEHMPSRVERLEQAVGQEDFDSAKAVAHEIKGVLANLSANNAMLFAKALEHAGNDRDAEQLHQNLPGFMQAYTHLNTLLNSAPLN